LGPFRRAKSRDQTSHAAGFAWLHPHFHPISQGKQADVRVLDELILEAGAFYVMDRGDVDFQRLYGLSGRRLFCHPFQNQSPIQPFGIAPGGLFDGCAQ